MATEPETLAAIVKAEWQVIFTTPYNFAGAVLFFLLLGWGAIALFYRTRISNAKSNEVTATNRANLYKEKFEILEADVAKGAASESKIEDVIRRSPALREAMREIVATPAITPVNPATPPENWSYAVLIPTDQVQKIAALSFLNATGTSVTLSATDTTYTTSASPSGVDVWHRISGMKKDG